MRRWLSAIFFSVSLAACSATDLIGLIKPNDGLQVDTEIVAGDKEEKLDAQLGNKQEVTADRIEGGVNTNNITNISPLVLILLLLGWMLPTPSRMGAWVARKFKVRGNDG